MKNSNHQDPFCNLHIAKNTLSIQTQPHRSFKFKETYKLLMFVEDHTSIFNLCVEDSTLESYALVTQVYDL